MGIRVLTGRAGCGRGGRRSGFVFDGVADDGKQVYKFRFRNFGETLRNLRNFGVTVKLKFLWFQPKKTPNAIQLLCRYDQNLGISAFRRGS